MLKTRLVSADNQLITRMKISILTLDNFFFFFFPGQLVGVIMRGEGRPHRDLSRVAGARGRSGAPRYGQEKLHVFY